MIRSFSDGSRVLVREEEASDRMFAGFITNASFAGLSRERRWEVAQVALGVAIRMSLLQDEEPVAEEEESYWESAAEHESDDPEPEDEWGRPAYKGAI